MPLTPDEFEEVCGLVCPHCRAGQPIRKRDDTGEYVHDAILNTSHAHALCWANGLRTSRYAP